MERGLAVVDYEKIETENPRAVERCPTGAIIWLEGRQFPGILGSDDPWDVVPARTLAHSGSEMS
jgi:hypothetical protein